MNTSNGREIRHCSSAMERNSVLPNSAWVGIASRSVTSLLMSGRASITP